MKANELRIGNYLAASDGILCEVIAIELDGYKTKPVNPIQSIPVFQTKDVIKPRLPIPLNEEWLIKFGFEKIIFDSEESGHGYEFHLDLNKYTKIIVYDDMSFCVENKQLDTHWLELDFDFFNGVHHLQNFVFSLTKKELEIQ